MLRHGHRNRKVITKCVAALTQQGGMVKKMSQQRTRRNVQEEKPAEVWFHQRFIDKEGCKIKNHLAKWWKSKSRFFVHNHSL